MVVVCVLVAPSTATTAQQIDPLAPTVFSNKHESEFGNFSHWSAVLQKGPQRIEIEYAVCNFAKATPLIYRWNGPNIGVGDGGKLPVGKCHVVDRDVAGIEHDRDAFIAFTQAGRKHPAPAHLSKLPLSSITSLLPRVVTNRLRTFYGPESDAAQPSLANLVVTQARVSDEVLRHTISWYPPTVAVAIGANAFAGANAESVSSLAKEKGFTAQVSTLSELLDPSSAGQARELGFPADQLTQPVIVIISRVTSSLSCF
jgi:hypothetical protein